MKLLGDLKNDKKILGITLLLTTLPQTAIARDQINIVGSSTVYPFAIVVAEKFGKTTDYKPQKLNLPARGGLKLFVQESEHNIRILQMLLGLLRKAK